jgi:hypothetical protein
LESDYNFEKGRRGRGGVTRLCIYFWLEDKGDGTNDENIVHCNNTSNYKV